MADDNKKPRTPNVADKPPEKKDTDTSDAFARANKPPAMEADEVTPGDPKPRSSKAGAKKAAPRSPAIDPDEIPMDPTDAAKEIVTMMKGLFTIAVAIRGYDKIVVNENGQQLLPMVEPKDEDYLRMEKALARLMKSAGTQMSPGAGVAFAALTTFGMPIASLEFSRAMSRKAK